MIFEILTGVFFLLSLVLGYNVRNLLLQNEQLEDTLLETLQDIQQKIETAYQSMQDADIRGSFESDDEVGSAFTEIKDIVENLKNTL
jgi:predicted PurR-regulated permease PerM